MYNVIITISAIHYSNLLLILIILCTPVDYIFVLYTNVLSIYRIIGRIMAITPNLKTYNPIEEYKGCL